MHFSEQVAAVALAAFLVVLIVKYWAYGGLKRTASDFRANLTLRVAKGQKEQLKTELKKYCSREELDKDGLLGRLHGDIEKHLEKQEVADGVWSSYVGQNKKKKVKEVCIGLPTQFL